MVCNEKVNSPTKMFIERLEDREWDLLKQNAVKTSFPVGFDKLCSDLHFHPFERVDLRKQMIFPIDCDDTKDRDDALSVSFDGVYHLGVHIADVADLVAPNSPLDREAMERATSIYLPTMTVPMFPEIISNGLCALCCEDRPTISVLMDIDVEGRLIGYRIVKSLIHPVMMCTYSEVNRVLSGSASEETAEKYQPIYNALILLRRLANTLRSRRKANGADTCSDKAPPKLILKNDTVDLISASGGIAEMIVEETMIAANHCVATHFRSNNLPAVFRIQNERNCLAEYHTARSFHASLNLDRYAHFTSPIRRLPDLRMGQVLSAHLLGAGNEALHYLFDDLLAESAEISTRRFRRARDMQKACAKMCYNEFFIAHSRERFAGKIVGYGSNCIYVRLHGLNVVVPVLDEGKRDLIGASVSLLVDADRRKSNYLGCDIRVA